MNDLKSLLGDKSKVAKHPKCRGEHYDFDEFDCGYATTLDCGECKYGVGRKDPEARCNQIYKDYT